MRRCYRRMTKYFFLLMALALTNPLLFGGGVSIEGLIFEPPPRVTFTDETYVLKTEKPDRWVVGTHLRGVIAGGTPLPGCLEPGSVVVKLPDGTVAEKGKDYLLDEHWAGLGRIEGGRIGAKDEVKISYRARE